MFKKKEFKTIFIVVAGVVVAITVLAYAVDFMGGVGTKIKSMFDN